MNAPAQNPVLFSDWQAHIAERLGGDPFDFSRDSPRTLEAADELGIRPAVEKAIAASRDDDATLTSLVDRATRAMKPQPLPAGPVVEPLPGYTASEIWQGYTPAPPIVQYIAEPDSVGVLVGPPGGGKSTSAIDIFLSATTGVSFQGLRVPRPVAGLYLGGEGVPGIRLRTRAWMIDKGLDASSVQPFAYFTSRGASLINRHDELLATVLAAQDAFDAQIELVVVDTWAANFGPGDENSSGDTQRAIRAVRDAAPGAAVVIVHHNGHADQDRERGSSALAGAADFRIKVTRDEFTNAVELRWLKVKDSEIPDPMVFELKKVLLDWYDDIGSEITSVVLERLEGAALSREPRVAGLGKNQEAALKALKTLLAKARRNLAERGDDPAKACILLTGWRADLERQGIDRRRFHEVQKDLQERRLIVVDGPHVIPMEA